MSRPTKAKVIVVQNHVSRSVDLTDSPSSTFAYKDVQLPASLPADTLLVRTLYISNDPVQLLWVQDGSRHDRKDIITAIPTGEPMKAFTVSRVVEVAGGAGTGEKFKVGDLVLVAGQWADYAVVQKSEARIVQELPGLSPSIWLGVLGHSGQTAYWGLVDILKLQKTDTLVVSGAAGSVGNVAVQYAKKVLHVARVIGIAGSDAKCEWLKSIGADEALNYKSPTFASDLAKATPDKVDKFFDNVGGSVLNEVLLRMNTQGIVAACGGMSIYGDPSAAILTNYARLILNRLSIVGFMLIAYADRVDEVVAALSKAVSSGQLAVDGAETVVDVRERFEEIPHVWNGLFEGSNTGKLITKLAD